MIRLGDRVKVKPVTFSVMGANGKEKSIPGRVVYIHPRGRYCTLEFEVGVRETVKLRESFQLVEGEILQ